MFVEQKERASRHMIAMNNPFPPRPTLPVNKTHQHAQDGIARRREGSVPHLSLRHFSLCVFLLLLLFFSFFSSSLLLLFLKLFDKLNVYSCAHVSYFKWFPLYRNVLFSLLFLSLFETLQIEITITFQKNFRFFYIQHWYYQLNNTKWHQILDINVNYHY